MRYGFSIFLDVAGEVMAGNDVPIKLQTTRLVRRLMCLGGMTLFFVVLILLVVSVERFCLRVGNHVMVPWFSDWLSMRRNCAQLL